MTPSSRGAFHALREDSSKRIADLECCRALLCGAVVDFDDVGCRIGMRNAQRDRRPGRDIPRLSPTNTNASQAELTILAGDLDRSIGEIECIDEEIRAGIGAKIGRQLKIVDTSRLETGCASNCDTSIVTSDAPDRSRASRRKQRAIEPQGPDKV